MVERSSGRAAGDQVSFGTLLRAFRERSLQTQEELAERSGLSSRAIRALEHGRVRNPRGESVRLLADALDLAGQERTRFKQAARQLTAPAIPADGPPSTTMGPAPSQLPPDVADFTGRAEQTGLLRDLLAGTAAAGAAPAVVVAAVAGKAGVGKTALALHVAHQLRGQFPDGQLYVNLRGAEQRPLEAAVALARFLRALGVDGAAIPHDQDQLEALYRTQLADRRVLVVLDNAASESQIRPLLPGVPGCAVLVTSRTRLAGLEGAQLLDLDVLGEGQAIQLLAQIIGAQRVAAEPGSAGAIVGFCGRLPLAVRVAGVRLATPPRRPLGQLAGLLADEHRRLDQLAAGDLEVRASLALSYRALTGPQQQAFRLLATLEVGDFSAWLAGPLLGIANQHAERLVEQLADAQLLDQAAADPTGASRYRFHDLVRLYGREQAILEEPLSSRHMALARVTAGWLALTEQADRRLPMSSDVVSFGGAVRWLLPRALVEGLLADPLAWLELERPNLMAAVEGAAAAGLAEPAWELAGCLTSFFLMRSHWASWKRVQEAALAACRHAGNRRGEAAALTALGRLSGTRWQTCSVDSLNQLLQALAIFRDLGDQRGEAKTLHDLAEFMLIRRHQASSSALLEAISYANQAQQLARAIGDHGIRTDALLALGGARRHLGRWQEAAAALEQARHLTLSMGDRHGQAIAMWQLAMVARDTGSPDDAGALLEQSLEITRSLHDRRGQAQLLLGLGTVRADEGLLEEAEALLADAIATWSGPDDHGFCAEVLYALGELRCRQRQYDRAAHHFAEAAALWQRQRAPAAQTRCLAALSDALAAEGRPREARAARQQARTKCQRQGASEPASTAAPRRPHHKDA
jgi:tetratricopeptide (TPR) repeat protein/DNA-binding XRE family transcriptional regulator